jgi:hypothetical protein
MKLLTHCLILSCFLSPPATAFFESNQHRYVAPYDLFKTLAHLFPIEQQQREMMPRQCLELSASNRAVTGDSQPLSGQPALSQPSTGFVRWYATCLNAYVNASTKRARDLWQSGKNPAAMISLAGEGVTAWLGKQKRDSLNGFELKWKELPSIDRKNFIHFQIFRMIGPEAVLTDLAYVSSEAELIQLIEKSFDGTESVQSALQRTMFFVAMRDEFLSY